MNLLNADGLLRARWAILVYSVVSVGIFLIQYQGLSQSRFQIYALLGLAAVFVYKAASLLPFLFVERFLLGRLLQLMPPITLRIAILGGYMFIIFAAFYEGPENIALAFARAWKTSGNLWTLIPFVAYFGLALYAEGLSPKTQSNPRRPDILDDL